MPRFRIRRNRPSFSQMSATLPAPIDPLAFLHGGRTSARDAYNQILGSFHDALADVEESAQLGL